MTSTTTSTTPRRLVYFRGHQDEVGSAMITQLCRDYETLSKLWEGESATRTLLNLYNLFAVRGMLSASGALEFRTSMSGPHHYFGWVDPCKQYVIDPTPDGLLAYREVEGEHAAAPALRPVPAERVLVLRDYEWISGAHLAPEMRAAYAVRDELAARLVDTRSGAADSLFDAPGLLLLPEPTVAFPLLVDPHEFDLRPFRAQIVPNDRPFAFDQSLVAAHRHAQHRLRVVTYNYGDDYLNGYLMLGSGVFIERHEFIQAITPLTPECGGFVMLGREVPDESGSNQLELVGCPVPFGCTLLVDVGSIHGDSTLTGLYMMAMTGNHVAMRTADTVFLKHRSSRRNVACVTHPALPRTPGLPATYFHITCADKSLADLRRVDDAGLKQAIRDSHESSWTALWWKPVVATGPAALGWHKTRASLADAAAPTTSSGCNTA